MKTNVFCIYIISDKVVTEMNIFGKFLLLFQNIL